MLLPVYAFALSQCVHIRRQTAAQVDQLTSPESGDHQQGQQNAGDNSDNDPVIPLLNDDSQREVSFKPQSSVSFQPQKAI